MYKTKQNNKKPKNNNKKNKQKIKNQNQPNKQTKHRAFHYTFISNPVLAFCLEKYNARVKCFQIPITLLKASLHSLFVEEKPLTHQNSSKHYTFTGGELGNFISQPSIAC